MTIREEIVAKVQSLPESVLPEVYEFVEKIEERKKSRACCVACKK